MIKSPCKDCPDREIRCHLTCEKYIEFKKESDKIREQRNAQKEKEKQYIEDNLRKYKRIIKR